MRLSRVSSSALLVAAACGGGLPEKQQAGDSQDIVVCPRAHTVQGLDVSEWQGSIDWGAVARSGRSFAYARVSDGFYHDATFAQNWPAMKRAGLIRGAYQFFEPNLDPVVQADLVVEAVGGNLEAGDLPPMLDVETADAGTPASRILWAIRAWVGRIQSRLGKKPVIYTGAWWWNPNTSGSAEFSSYPLNDSFYSTSCPNIAAGWGNWSFWQYTSSGQVGGIAGNVDFDTFNGSMDELRSFAGGGATPGGPCAGRYGLWCGAELGLNADVLYRCDGDAQQVQVCQFGCHINPPGVADACDAAPPERGPCTGMHTGLYCGSEIGLDANTLYSCDGGARPRQAQPCDNGCKVNPPGINDACNPPPQQAGPCSGKTAGLWCGASLGLDANTLYSCDGGADAQVADNCGYGCQQNPPGTGDACKPQPAPTGPCSGKAQGLWCGSQIGLDANTLYTCSGAPDPSDQQGCDYGCEANPPGVNDQCKPQPAGPCKGHAVGLWCGGQLGLDAGTLYSCDDSSNDASVVQTCDEGCQFMPAGTDDQCYAADCSQKPDGNYCGSDQIDGNPALLYTCIGGDVDSVNACSAGCQILPTGAADRCG